MSKFQQRSRRPYRLCRSTIFSRFQSLLSSFQTTNGRKRTKIRWPQLVDLSKTAELERDSTALLLCLELQTGVLKSLSFSQKSPLAHRTLRSLNLTKITTSRSLSQCLREAISQRRAGTDHVYDSEFPRVELDGIGDQVKG